MTNGWQLLPLLTVVSAPFYGAGFRVRPGSWVIGRAEDADILVGDRRVSRRHAVVESVDGRVVLTDAGSTNGTFLNDRRITGPEELYDGDRIRIAGVEMTFSDLGSARTDPIGAFRRQLPRLVPDMAALQAPTQANRESEPAADRATVRG